MVVASGALKDQILAGLGCNRRTDVETVTGIAATSTIKGAGFGGGGDQFVVCAEYMVGESGAYDEADLLFGPCLGVGGHVGISIE